MDERDQVISHKVLASDHVLFKGGQVIVHTQLEMKDWELRKYRRTQILFEGNPYCIVHIDASARGEIRYFLEPWGPNLDDIPGKTIRYDENFVRERDRALKEQKKAERHGYFLVALTPLLGLLYSGLKRRIEDQYGISARISTRLSLYLEGFCLLASGVTVTIFTLAAGIGPAFGAEGIGMPGSWFLPLFILVLVPDFLMRYSSSLKDESSPPGFYEWLIRSRRED